MVEYCASFVNSKSVFLKVKKLGVGRALFCSSFCKKHFFFGFVFECDDLTNFLGN